MPEPGWRQRIMVALGVRLRNWGSRMLSRAVLVEESEPTLSDGPPVHWLELLARSEVPLRWQQGSPAGPDRRQALEPPSTPTEPGRSPQAEDNSAAREAATAAAPPPQSQQTPEHAGSKRHRLVFEPPVEEAIAPEPSYVPPEQTQRPRVRFEPGHISSSPAALAYKTLEPSSAPPETDVEISPAVPQERPEAPPTYEPAEQIPGPEAPAYVQRARRLVAKVMYAFWPRRRKPTPTTGIADSEEGAVPPQEPGYVGSSRRQEPDQPAYSPPPLPSSIPAPNYTQPVRAQAFPPHYDIVEKEPPVTIPWPQRSDTSHSVSRTETADQPERQRGKQIYYGKSQMEDPWPRLPVHPLLDTEVKKPAPQEEELLRKLQQEQAGVV